MRLAALTVGVITLVVAVLLGALAVWVGFDAFVVPIAIAEAVLLAAVYFVRRGLAGEEDAF